ncbi:Asp23/Gls24 family envelope stress response protein [Actinomadura sp. WMMB 499]|uniref:Asp23/Gls24 family envelope stress response protein n=1 Tax=Actinomadura sp. WMMB 499 TaxID=1219491 RepID=UPI001247B0CB|nr:Asp23/Gls24 family envelope stress response protein [Actinomadura sp. WMMB 499]QFG26429.1 Asp23/Gls24 family envelope stress response protein [Actinomadura sp. WMMB 499]
MSEPDERPAEHGRPAPRPDTGPMRFFSGPPGPMAPPGTPLSAPPPAAPEFPGERAAAPPAPVPPPRPHRDAAPPAAPGGAGVDGRIAIEDAVIDRIAELAALDVRGVVALSVPGADGEGGVRVRVRDDEVTLDVGIVVAYGSVIRDVAAAVQESAARMAGLMLGMRVAVVNVSVEDVRRPAGAPPA